MAQCPYCGSKMADPPITDRLTLKQGQVYETVLAAGPEGVPSDRLMKDLFKGRSPTTLRSCIYYVNLAIAPMKIEGRKKSYFLSGK